MGGNRIRHFKRVGVLVGCCRSLLAVGVCVCVCVVVLSVMPVLPVSGFWAVFRTIGKRKPPRGCLGGSGV